jgi:hypothetical protein
VCLSIVRDPRFFDFLVSIDRDLAEQVRLDGCFCGGRLHRADYPRKPRGGPGSLGRFHTRRLSWCCAVEGCRCRKTPPSVRFLGRRVYWAAVVVLVSALSCGITASRAAQLRESVGVSLRTLRRWRQWWRETFVDSRLWRGQRSCFVPPVQVAALPASLVERFAGDERQRLISALEFLSPLTTRSASAMAVVDPQKMHLERPRGGT